MNLYDAELYFHLVELVEAEVVVVLRRGYYKRKVVEMRPAAYEGYNQCLFTYKTSRHYGRRIPVGSARRLSTRHRDAHPIQEYVTAMKKAMEM